MTYFLLIEGTEYGPYTREQIVEGLIEGTILKDQAARLEGFPNWLPLSDILEIPNAPQPPSEPIYKTVTKPAVVTAPMTQRHVPVQQHHPTSSRLPDKIRVGTHLEMIRTNTCYGALRSIINICYAILILGGVVFAAGGVVLMYQQDYSAGFTGIAASIILWILSTAARQAAFLLVDIADTLIFDHSKNP
jgi:hypothetical protein